jgi:DNA-binding NtrC family response regulator
MKKVMIIDDELDILEVLGQYLNRSGKLDVEMHSNPDTALQVAKGGGYDLLLSDIMMPSTSGIEILKEMKKTSPNIKVILMTAYSTNAKVQESKELGVDEYLEKPFKDLKSVEQKIFSLLNI